MTTKGLLLVFFLSIVAGVFMLSPSVKKAEGYPGGTVLTVKVGGTTYAVNTINFSTGVSAPSNGVLTVAGTDITGKANTASPTFTGTVTLPGSARSVTATSAPVSVVGGSQSETATASGLDVDSGANWHTSGNMQRWLSNNGTLKLRLYAEDSLGVSITRFLASDNYFWMLNAAGDSIKMSGGAAIYFGIGGTSVNYQMVAGAFLPQTNNAVDLGVAAQDWRDVRLTRNVVGSGTGALGLTGGSTSAGVAVTGTSISNAAGNVTLSITNASGTSAQGQAALSVGNGYTLPDYYGVNIGDTWAGYKCSHAASFLVDTGGSTTQRVQCLSGANKVQNCTASANLVASVGVAMATVASGGVVKVCDQGFMAVDSETDCSTAGLAAGTSGSNAGKVQCTTAPPINSRVGKVSTVVSSGVAILYMK